MAESLVGQGVVGKQIASPWWDGTYEITQGWGDTDYGAEPAEQRTDRQDFPGYHAHWHAGVDIGAPCGVHIKLPDNLRDDQGRPITGKIDVHTAYNAGGYGNMLTVFIGDFDVILGHLQNYLVRDGDVVRPGQDLAIVDTTGNSSGCHIHFEVRPRGGRYGTDINPSPFLDGVFSSAGQVANPVDTIGAAITGASKEATRVLIGGGQVILGAVLTLLALGAVALGARGGTPAGAIRALSPLGRFDAVRRRVPRATTRQVSVARPAPAERLPSRTEAEAALRSGRRLTPAEARALGAEPAEPVSRARLR